jgi:hypothetical protein
MTKTGTRVGHHWSKMISTLDIVIKFQSQQPFFQITSTSRTDDIWKQMDQAKNRIFYTKAELSNKSPRLC